MSKQRELTKLVIFSIIVFAIGCLILMFISGCNNNSQPRISTPYDIKTINGTNSMEVIVIDSCEYLVYRAGAYQGLLTHKGNCKYCSKR